jgi:hypothetical protein
MDNVPCALLLPHLLHAGEWNSGRRREGVLTSVQMSTRKNVVLILERENGLEISHLFDILISNDEP